MYLLTFAMIMIAMLGLYTQVYAVQVARMFANETSIADNIVAWHEAAASLANNVINTTTNPLTIAGCSLSFSLVAPAYCIKGAASGGLPSVTVTGNGNYANPAGYIFPQLPGTFNSVTYQWKSIAYQPTPNTFYVITFVPPPLISATNPPPGYISTATAPPHQLTITMGDLMHQLQASGLPLYSFGYVSGGKLITASTLPPGAPTFGAAITYPVPPVAEVPNNSIAIISSPGHCAAC